VDWDSKPAEAQEQPKVDEAEDRRTAVSLAYAMTVLSAQALGGKSNQEKMVEIEKMFTGFLEAMDYVIVKKS
jgi:hypothetical protein